MITEDYCSYEVAKLLKEKGFDGFCVACYNRDGDFRTIYDDTLGEIGLENWNALTEQDYKRMGLASWYGSISAPTHQMAMKWLREVHRKYIDIRYNNQNEKYRFIVFTMVKDKPIDFIHSEFYNTYEETTDAALFYVLENLI